jgi:hypothetical protein
MAQLLDFGLVPSFRLRKAVAQLLEGFPNFLNLALMLSALLFVVQAKLAELAFEMLGALFFVLDVKLEELALEMLNPGNPFWNGSIQPAHRSGKKIGFSRFRSLQSVRYVGLLPFARRCDGAAIGLGNQSPIKFDHFCRNAGIDHFVNREMGVASLRFYQRRGAVDFPIGQTGEMRYSPQFSLRISEKEIVVSNEPLVPACCLDQA